MAGDMGEGEPGESLSSGAHNLMNEEDKLCKKISAPSGGKEPTRVPKQPLHSPLLKDLLWPHTWNKVSPGWERHCSIGLLGARLPAFTGTRRESTFTSRVTAKRKRTRLGLRPRGQEALILMYETVSKVRAVSVVFL